MKQEERAMQIWPILISAAHDRKILRYGDLRDLLGFEGAGVFAGMLDPIMRFCERNGHPPLTMLVVNQESGMPGDGLTTVADMNQDRERVFNYQWFQLHPPQIHDFAE